MFISFSTASKPAKAKLFDQDDLENRLFYSSEKLYSNNGGIKKRLEKSWFENRFLRNEKRKSKLDNGANEGRKSKQTIKNLSASNEEIGREFILVFVSIVHVVFHVFSKCG